MFCWLTDLTDMSTEKIGCSNINGIFDTVLRDVEFSTVENVLVSFLQGHEEFSTTEKNFLCQCEDEKMKANIIVVFLKAILARDFEKFCQFLEESTSETAQNMGFNLLKEAKSLIENEIPGKKI